jgi:hypothetical protein
VSVSISGPFLDVKGSQSQPYRVTLYEPGRLAETHRFPAREPAQAFADQQRELRQETTA